MSSTQRPSRRLSARLQEKDDAGAPVINGAYLNGRHSKNLARLDSSRPEPDVGANARKRRNEYDEEDDGFTFTRVNKRKKRTVVSEGKDVSAPAPPPPQKDAHQASSVKVAVVNGGVIQPLKTRRTKLSFSTPNPKEEAPVRRSKRLSRDHDQQDRSPHPTAPPKDQQRSESQAPAGVEKPLPPRERDEATAHAAAVKGQNIPVHDDHSATKIALPFADTPVIKRNKAMREGKGGKSERRSSLSLRGRRASSLIETGNSNALPHQEVEIPDFYKHIESDGLPEPRRMRQLLTWCATRALDAKPIGTDFEDSSARSAARVIEEELLKDLANRSELSDWFSREDTPAWSTPLPERPNPKNVQNSEKIAELEEQIRRWRTEKEALEALLRPPAVVTLSTHSASISSDHSQLDRSLLSDSDTAVCEALDANTISSAQVSDRLNGIKATLGPAIDAFTDGIHQIDQYRGAAENVAGRVLAMCAEQLANREREGRKRALPQTERSPSRDLTGVLRSLSRLDR